MRKAAIEDASLGMLEVFEKVSTEAKREKNAVPPPNKMIYYWTRKPLIVGRAVVLACTLKDPKHVEDLLGLNKDVRAYKKSPTGYANMLDSTPSDIKVLDIFSGTGNLILPAVELGLNVTCSDYNPLAYLITRGSLEIPSTSGLDLVVEFESAANTIINEVELEVGRFYEPRSLAYIWAWCIRCVHCGQRMPLLNQMYLSKKNNIGLRLTPTSDKNFTVDIVRNMSAKEGHSFTHKGGKVQCISCRNTIEYDDMTRDIAVNRDKELLTKQIQKPGRQGRDYILPSEEDREQYDAALKYFKTNQTEILKSIPTEGILASHRKRNTLWIYGIETWNQFFSPRQLIVLSTLVQKINTYCETTNSPHLPALRVYLSFLIARLVNYYSYGVCWHSSRDSPAPTLALRQPRIVFNLAEINPFEKVSGSLRNNITNIVKGIEFCTRLKTPVTCKMESVTTSSDQQYDIIITDPPYGDDVQYGELSEFFYLWMYKILKDGTLPARVPLDEDFCESWGRFGDKGIASEFFKKGLKKSFVSIASKLKDDGILCVFFAHSSTHAWNQLLLSLRAGGFRVVSSYAIHTESENNPLSRNKVSFKSSIVVVCRKITEDSSGFMDDILPDAEDRISKILDNTPNNKLLTLPITDLLVMVYGKVLESCTRYRTLKSRSGDSIPDFETLLDMARSAVMRLLVSKLTKSSMNTVGPRMAFYIFAKVFYGGSVSADDMLKMTKAYNIEQQTLVKDGVYKQSGGACTLTYIHKNEMDFPAENVSRDNLHQQLCYLARQVETGKAKTIDGILDGENFRRTTLKQIVGLLLQSIDMRKNRGESMDENNRDEMRILKTLADIMGVRVEGGLDAFMPK